MNSYQIDFITPLFSRGAYTEIPEVRAASIRGQLHWWFRALGGNYADEKAIFGGVHNGAVASKIVVRVSALNGRVAELPTLPHKHGGQASPRIAYAAGTTFQLHLLQRLGGLDDKQNSAFQRTLETWLVIGSLGYRATRGGGCFRWKPLVETTLQPPASFTQFEARCSALLNGSRLQFALLEKTYANTDAARRDITDTLGGRDDRPGQNDLARLNDPLGKVFGGRKTSPLRLRVVGVEGQFRIAAVWDGRTEVTGNRPGDLPGVIALLNKAGKPIGHQLSLSTLAR